MNLKAISSRILILIIILFLSATASAEPLPPSDPKEYCDKVSVVEAEYVSYSAREGKEISYFNGARAKYRLLRSLRGDAPPESFTIIYEFHDGSPCEAPPDWKFNEQLLPKAGSRWLLLLMPDGRNNYQTYRGASGRVALGQRANEYFAYCKAFRSGRTLPEKALF